MPTGYTADVADGKVTDLKSFASHLARGMGALLSMRDDPWDAPLPEVIKPYASDYSTKALAEARAERDRLYALSDDEAQAAADAAFAEWEQSRDKAEADHSARRGRYEAMITKVEAWQGAPEGIKEFGLQQLREGMRFDCSEPFSYWSPEPVNDGAAWKAAALEKAAKDIEYHSVELAKSASRAEGANAWLQQLRASLESVDA